MAYARLRLEKCRYGADKPTCAKCTTHCYRPAMRERVRAVMRYSGPRMLKRASGACGGTSRGRSRKTPDDEADGRRAAPRPQPPLQTTVARAVPSAVAP